MTGNLWILLAAGGAVVAVFVALSLLADNYNLNNIKSRTVGDGQHGTARWATEQEIRSSYALVPFRVADWRAGRQESAGSARLGAGQPRWKKRRHHSAGGQR